MYLFCGGFLGQARAEVGFLHLGSKHAATPSGLLLINSTLPCLPLHATFFCRNMLSFPELILPQHGDYET